MALTSVRQLILKFLVFGFKVFYSTNGFPGSRTGFKPLSDFASSSNLSQYRHTLLYHINTENAIGNRELNLCAL